MKPIVLLVVVSCSLCIAGAIVMKATVDPTHRSLGELLVLAGLVMSALPFVSVVLARQAERRARKRDFPSARTREDR